jgi:general secretion pathway protein D
MRPVPAPAHPRAAVPAEAGEGLAIDEFLRQALPEHPDRIITLDPATGILTVTDTKANHRIIRQLLKRLDVGPRQVMIEAKFVEVAVKDLYELGIEWDFFYPGRVSDKWTQLGVGDPRRPDMTGIYWTDDGARFPATTMGADVFISITKLRGARLMAYLHALEERGKATLLSAPRVTTLPEQMANIEIIKTVPYTSEFAIENIGTAERPIWRHRHTINEVDLGIVLEVTPRVAEGSDIITLDLRPSIDVLTDRVPVHTLVPEDMGWPVIDTRTTQTTVYVKSGTTIILGGLIRDTDLVTEKRVPVLGSIPLLGNLFRYKHRDREKRNLLIFITATLITVDGDEI